MNIAFRVDASKQIGTGHFMRDFALANALKQHGAQIYFISRYLPPHLHIMLQEQGHEYVLLENNHENENLDELAHAQWLGVSQAQDASDTINVLSKKKWDWIIIDHYALDYRWESLLRKFVTNILVIDDIADRKHDCDILIDQNYYIDMSIRYKNKVPNHCKLLLGPRYALLQKKFKQLHDEVIIRRGPVKRILVFFGGIDVNNYTGNTIKVLSEIMIQDLVVDVVIGEEQPFSEKIRKTCEKYGYSLHVQTNKMAELMANADLAIGAAGSASWERCCMGLPALLVALADNQINIAKALDSYGACEYIDESIMKNATKLHNKIINIIEAQNKLSAFSKKAYSLVDGAGVERVFQTMNC